MTFGNQMTAERTQMPSPDILDLVLHKVAIEVCSEFAKNLIFPTVLYMVLRLYLMCHIFLQILQETEKRS